MSALRSSASFLWIALVAGPLGAAPLTSTPAVAQQLQAEGSAPGVRIVVQELRRDESNSVTLRFQLINDSDKAYTPGCAFREAPGRACGEIGGVHLIDNTNKKKYLVVRDAAGKCACATVHRVDKGGRLNLWAKFAAPPANVEKITVVVPEYQPIDGVPITR
jgi:hypothetical protein